MNEELVRALTAALRASIPPERAAEVAGLLQAQISGRGGLSAEEVDGEEPAFSFQPGWPG